MSIRAQWQVTFGDADPAGIAYYPRILDACHRAFESFFSEAVGEPYAETFLRKDLGFPTVSLQADFRAPMRFGDMMLIDVSIAAISSRSVTFLYRFTRAADGVACAEIRNVTAAVHRTRFRSMEIPDFYRVRFEAHREQPDSRPRS